jgi:hypothetical protein
MPLAPIYETPDTPELSNNNAGVSVPFGVSVTGGLLTSMGEANDITQIVLALLEETSENAFQQPLVSIEASLFDINDPSSNAIVRQKLESVFAVFETQHRYRLINESVQLRNDGDGGTEVYFQYHNLESDQIQELSVSI